MLAWILSVVVALLVSAAPAVAEEGRRVALVIGNDTYQSLAPLDNPRLDAGRLAALLDANGFDVVRCDGQRPGCFNLDRDGLEEALYALRSKAKGAELALVFYAGHGMEGSTGNVLAPIDMQVSDCTERALRRAVSLTEVFNAVAEARRKIVILDACRNNPFAQCPPARGSRPVSFGDFSVSEVESFLLVSSTKPGQVASDGYPGAHSPYARALVHWLEQAPRVQFHEVLSHVAKDVIEDTARSNDTQVPEMVVRGGGADGCLKGADCAGDLKTAALQQELEALKERHTDDQRVAETVRSYLAEAEKGRSLSEDDVRQVVASFKQVGDLIVEVENGQGRPFSKEEKARELARLMDAGRALLALKDTRSERALELLKAGDETEAKRLFAEAAAARQKAARAAQSRAEEENREAAKALRHLAAIAKPKSVAEAADHYKEATRLDPADALTWIDYGLAALAAGRREEARTAFEQADAKAREMGNVLVQVRAALGLGDIAPAGSEERHYEAALALAKQLATTHPDDVATERALAIAHARVGSVRMGKRELSAALESYKATLAIAERLAKARPDDGEQQQILDWALYQIGIVYLAQDKHADALATYQAALDIAERYSKAKPDDDGWLSDKRNLHGAISDVQRRLGDLDGALSNGRKAFDIDERLGKADPSNFSRQFALAYSHYRMGSLLGLNGNHMGALERYEAAVAIYERLVVLDPGMSLLQQNIAVTRSSMAEVLRQEGKLGDALANLQAGLVAYKTLSASEPANAEWYENAAVSHNRIAGVLEAQGNLAGALDSYRAALEDFSKAPTGKSLTRALHAGTHGQIARLLDRQGDLAGALASYRAMQSVLESQPDPGEARWQQMSVQAHALTAGVLRRQGDLDGALAGFRAALAGFGKIDKVDAGWQGTLGEIHTNIGGVLRELGDLAAALASYRAALPIYESLAKAEPANNPRQVQLGAAYGNVAAVLEIHNDLAGALAGYRAALDINDRLAKADPANADWQSNVFFWHSKVGGVLLRQRHLAEALSSHRTALGIAERLAKANPANRGWQWSVASSTYNVAAVLYAKGDRAGALAGWRKALAIAETQAAAAEQEETKGGGKAGKTTAEALGSLAYYALYARDFRKALAAAERAHTLAPYVIWPEINRASALALLGRSREARALYLAYKGKSTLGDPWARVVVSDFRNLREAGLVHPMMRQVEAALGETLGVTSEAARPSAGVHRSTK
ncbi:MAG: caspase family protein [Hyphomicrobiaceae bacterium]|nr:caspase family protein [Hyphomicrobiaceae bacterium]